MTINENLVRSLIKSGKEKEVVEDQDEVKILTVMAQTSIQLTKCVDTGYLNDFMKKRVLDTVKLVNKTMIGKNYYFLGEEILLLFKKILHTLHPCWWKEAPLISDRHGSPYASINSDEINRAFSDEDLYFLEKSWFVVSALIRRQQIIADNLYLDNALGDPFLGASVYQVAELSEM